LALTTAIIRVPLVRPVLLVRLVRGV